MFPLLPALALLLACTAELPLSRKDVAPPRTITFGGIVWNVKAGADLMGPGPNYFSDSERSVWVDARGRLHLALRKEGDRWLCAEIVSQGSPGYGEYTFDFAAAPEIDPQAILGLFTWHNSDTAYHNREIDIELGRWAQADNQNAQFVVQPYETPGNIKRFDIPSQRAPIRCGFNWKPGRVQFDCSRVTAQGALRSLCSWVCTSKDIPPTGGEAVRINLWLFRGKPPIAGKNMEVIIEKFNFKPLKLKAEGAISH